MADNLLTVENMYASAEDYNARMAKDKAFKDALIRAAQIALESETIDSLSKNWKLPSLLVSYRVHDERIEEAKYSAYFDFTFDLDLLKSLVKEKTSEENGMQRVIFFDKQKNPLFENWIKQFALNIEKPAIEYGQVQEIYENDILVIPSFKPSGNFLISIERGNNLYNIAAASLSEVFIESLQYANYLVNQRNNKNSNVIFFDLVNRNDVREDDLYQKINNLIQLNSLRVVSYGSGAIPKFAVDISEKDDLFLRYVYNTGDYKIDDLNLFEQLM